MTQDEEIEEEDFSPSVGIDRKEGDPTRAYLVGAYFKTVDKQSAEEHLDELEDLSNTFGVDCIEKCALPLKKIDSATFFSKGKLDFIAEKLQSSHANLLILDEEISPAQQRNLEKFLKVAVMDRTELILEIFAQRAQTKEARLQIEYARTKYQFPRLKRLWSHFSRQRASGGYLKGEGEKQLEIDRRLLKVKLEKLKNQIEEVKKIRFTQSASRRRSGIATFAILGYTNAGKSTLLNALTHAEVLVEDKLFATLDPTTRKFILPNKQEILLTDTVGFIRKLPHTLVAAFRSTLEAALHDDILIHLVDISHPQAEEHAVTTLQLLKELGANEDAIITVFNKIDKCSNPRMLEKMRLLYPKSVAISALLSSGFDELLELMMRELAQRQQVVKLAIPQSQYALVAQIKREGRILYEEYEENRILLRAEIPVRIAHFFDAYRIDDI